MTTVLAALGRCQTTHLASPALPFVRYWSWSWPGAFGHNEHPANDAPQKGFGTFGRQERPANYAALSAGPW